MTKEENDRDRGTEKKFAVKVSSKNIVDWGGGEKFFREPRKTHTGDIACTNRRVEKESFFACEGGKRGEGGACPRQRNKGKGEAYRREPQAAGQKNQAHGGVRKEGRVKKTDSLQKEGWKRNHTREDLLLYPEGSRSKVLNPWSHPKKNTSKVVRERSERRKGNGVVEPQGSSW